MTDLLGSVIFATMIGIGLLDLQSGSGPFARYRSAPSRDRGRTPNAGRTGEDNQPTPPEPAR